MIIEQHASWAAWAEAIASFTVAVIALVVVFLQRWLDHRAKRQQISWNSALAVHHARGALQLLMELQIDFVARLRTGLSAANRQWAFELDIAYETTGLALKTGLEDPALLEDIVAVRAWIRLAQGVVDYHPRGALDQLQTSTIARQETSTRLLQMQKRFIVDSVRLWPRKAERHGSDLLGSRASATVAAPPPA